MRSLSQRLRLLDRQRMIQEEQRLLRDGRFAALRDVQVGVGEVEHPQRAGQELPVDQAVQRAPAERRR